jgi:hypothetical protein
VPNRNHISAPQEQVGFAEGDAPVHHLGGSSHNEESVAVLFELRALMRLEGMIDRKLVEPELGL